jgi:hypothetical protein
MRHRALVTIPLVLLLPPVALMLGGCDPPPPKGIEFLPYEANYASKPDFARVEHEKPLLPADLAKLQPSMLKRYDQEQVDQIYARLTAGPIPDGAYEGDLFFPKGISGDRRIREIIGGLPGLAVGAKTVKLELIGKNLWRGKVFFRDERLLRNRVEDLSVLKPILGGDTSELRKIEVSGKDQWLLFPARLYCGQSLLDSRRESVIIDYAYTDEIPGYRERPDFLAGRRGVQIRDEIRMVRPGFYLGRAYLGKVFVLNFVLYNKEVAERDGEAYVRTGEVAEDCWAGTQLRRVVAAS